MNTFKERWELYSKMRCICSFYVTKRKNVDILFFFLFNFHNFRFLFTFTCSLRGGESEREPHTYTHTQFHFRRDSKDILGSFATITYNRVHIYLHIKTEHKYILQQMCYGYKTILYPLLFFFLQSKFEARQQRRRRVQGNERKHINIIIIIRSRH